MLVTFMLALSGCGAQLVDDGSGFLKTKDGSYVKWPQGTNVKFLSDDSVPVEVRNQLVSAQHEINDEMDRISVSVEVAKSSAPSIRNSKDDVIGDGKNAIYFLEEPWPWKNVKGKENSDAMTVLINRGNSIVEADIFYRKSTYTGKLSNAAPDQGTISVSSFALSTAYAANVDTDQKWTKVAFLHECMHAIGFTHVNERDSLMYPVVSLGLYTNPFSDLDIDRITTLY